MRQRLPQPYELVIGTVKKIEDHGAFVTLDEYGGLEAYVPLNEVSHSWFRNIREVVKIGQKRVFKVIRVDRRRGLVDVSLKRVSDSERREKLQAWKRNQRALKLLEMAAKQLGKSLDEAYAAVGEKLEKSHSDMLAGLEAAIHGGREELEKAGIGEPWLSVIYELAKTHIKLPKVKASAIFTVKCMQGDGVVRLREVLGAWEEVKRRYPSIEAKFYTSGAPRYKVDVEAYDYRVVESFLGELSKVILLKAEELGCTAAFERVKV